MKPAADKAGNYTRLGHLTGRQHGVAYKLAAPLAAIGEPAPARKLMG